MNVDEQLRNLQPALDAAISDARSHHHSPRVAATRRRAPALVAAAAVVVVVAAVAVALAHHGSHRGGANLTIEALATTTQQQSARVTITQMLSSGPSDTHPERLVTTGLADYRKSNGRFETTTQSGSDAAQPFQTELVVAGHQYFRIGPWLQGIPESLIRTKKWVDVDTPAASLPSAGLNPFDPFSLFKSSHVSLEDRGTTKFRGQTVEHYTATKRISTPPSSGPAEHGTFVFDVYVDRHGRATHVQVGDREAGANSIVQIDFSDYGVRVDVAAPPANLIVRASALPSDEGPSPTSGRRGALVLREDIDTSAAECKTPGTLTNTGPIGSNGPRLCTLLGATIATGDDIVSASVGHGTGSRGGWCIAPVLTADAFAQLQSYMQAEAPLPDLFVISHGKFLGEVLIDEPVRNGDCWIRTDRLTEATARALVAELPSR